VKNLSECFVVAHRGYSGKFPENTFVAFEQAISAGADALEMDLQVSADGHVMVLHDELLGRLARMYDYVYNLKKDELKKLDVGSWMSEEFKGARIPTFKEVCEKIAPRIPLVLELKNNHYPYPDLEERVLKLVHEYQLRQRVMIVSFNHRSIDKVKALDPRIKTGLIIKKASVLDQVPFSNSSEFICASREILDEKILQKIKERGKNAMVWTVDDEAEMKKYLGMELAAIFTNHPPRLLGLLHQS
jgi:glycerophosphoryl diester phosphodiesterase